MKLFLSTDFEGVSGIVAWEQIIEGNSGYEQGRRLLTNEVTAVFSGALEGEQHRSIADELEKVSTPLKPLASTE